MDDIRRRLKLKYVLFCILVTLVIPFIISITPVNNGRCTCDVNSDKYPRKGTDNVAKTVSDAERHRLAILVPFRDRFDELLTFVPYIRKFLDRQNIDHRIFILNQIDKFRFNRASLINVGFLRVRKDFDYIAMHDVDLLPMNDKLSYSFPTDGPYHVSSPELHPRYHYPTFVGGILLIRREHFILANGMSNKYWGWGLEDDEFYIRLKEAGLTVKRPENISTGIRDTFKHIHDRNHRKRDTVKCHNQRAITRKRDRQTGLSNVSYKILDEVEVTIAGVPLTVLNVLLACDKTSTPWCECDKAESPSRRQERPVSSEREEGRVVKN